MKRSLRRTPVSPLSTFGPAASGSSPSQTVPSLSGGTSTRPTAASGMTMVTAQALLMYLRGCGVGDACAIELITYCARRAGEAN
jgi:hypothetical protein